MRLRSVSVLSVAGAFVTWVVLASAQTITPSVLKKLHDAEWTVRAQAFEQLTADPQMMRASTTRRALIEPLDRENTFPIRSEVEREAYGAYYFRLQGRVILLVDPGDVSSVAVLVQSAYNPDSHLALQLASYGQTVVPALFEIADRQHGIPRGNAYEVLGRVLRVHRLGTSRYPLTAQSVRRIENRIRGGLRDPEPAVRMLAIHAVIAAGDVASILILRQMQASDPYVLDGTDKFWIREQAEKAIVTIQANPLGK